MVVLAAMAAEARSSSPDPVVQMGVNVSTVRRLCKPVAQEHKKYVFDSVSGW